MAFLKDFKEFAMRGNVVDMAVGVVIGGAFGKIVTSLVNDVIMPVVGVLTGGVNFTDYKLTLHEEVKDAAGEVIEPLVTLNWGTLVQNVVDFVIIAFCIFLMIRAMQKMRKKEEAAPAAPPAPSAEETLLTEIRDLLKQQNNK